MCLSVDRTKHDARELELGQVVFLARKLTEPLSVWKVLMQSDEGDWFSPFRDYQWQLGEMQVADLVPEAGYEKLPYLSSEVKSYVHVGLHSYECRERAQFTLVSLRIMKLTYHNAKLMRAIIPAGSLVFFGDNGDVVSNQLMVLGEEQEQGL